MSDLATTASVEDSPPAAAEADAAGLVYVHDHDPGLARVRRGRGVTFRDAQGRTVKDQATLDRIRRLAIPPAWSEVWICADPRGHIQAVGRDQRGRKQYLYHAWWRAHRDETKFDRMAEFGRRLQRLRRQVEADLQRPGLPREKVLAAVVRLLETTLIRVGNDEYAIQNKSFGLTTMRKQHVEVAGSGGVFEFRGKSGKVHRTGFRDRRLARVVKRCEELPGQRLFQYLDDDGQRRAIGSADVNAYLHEAIGNGFTAKDFRTWAGTLICALALAEAEPAASEAAAKRIVATCVKRTAAALGNTPAVCRASYIHPRIIECYAEGGLADQLNPRSPERSLLSLVEARGGSY